MADLPDFQVFMKPAGNSCNLDCTYCYYNCQPHGERSGQRVMTDEVLEALTMQNIEASGTGEIFFTWHGGEPTLAGTGFYKKAVALQKKHLPRGGVIRNGIQTNGTLLDKEWCRFLADNNFAAGISIDGCERFHDAARLNHSGRGSFAQALKGFRMLKDHGVEPEILCVVSSLNAGEPLHIYDFFRSLGAKWITFLPLVIKDERTPSAVLPPTVGAGEFGDFLCTIFDEWVANDIGSVKIQIIEEALRTAFNPEHTLCIFKRECGGVPVVERNGDFYSCDHYVNSDNRIGNIMDIPIARLLAGDRQKAFGRAKLTTLPQYCLDCEVLEMCNGECPKNRFITTPTGEPGLNYLCTGYRRFFNHVRPFVEEVRGLTDI